MCGGDRCGKIALGDTCICFHGSTKVNSYRVPGQYASWLGECAARVMLPRSLRVYVGAREGRAIDENEHDVVVGARIAFPKKYRYGHPF